MTRLIINPGTGPVAEATVEHARANIRQMIIDAGVSPDEVGVVRHPDGDRNGRFCFHLHHGDEGFSDVEMPGRPIEEVRYLGKPQNIWHFPRLYVGGSSWVWCYAIGFVRAGLLCIEEDEE